MTDTLPPFDPTLDLLFEREVPLPPAAVWAAWTTPALICQWFCPLPWCVTDCQIDLRPGGTFATVMQSPEGQSFPNLGTYLAVEPTRYLVWTDVLLPGFRPAPKPFITAHLTFTATTTGTHYRAHVLHANAADRERHEAMGFADGWGKALDQLVALMSKA